MRGAWLRICGRKAIKGVAVWLAVCAHATGGILAWVKIWRVGLK